MDSISLDDIYPDNKLRLAQLIDSEKPTAISHAAAEGRGDMVWLLLTRSDIEPDMKNDSSRTALSWAAGNKHECIVRMLLDSHADPEAKDEFGQTPLFFAVQNRHEAIVKMLLDKGAKIEIKDTRLGQTSLLIVVQNDHEAFVKLLLDKGAAIVRKGMFGHASLAVTQYGNGCIGKLLDRGAAVKVKNSSG